MQYVESQKSTDLIGVIVLMIDIGIRLKVSTHFFAHGFQDMRSLQIQAHQAQLAVTTLTEKLEAYEAETSQLTEQIQKLSGGQMLEVATDSRSCC